MRIVADTNVFLAVALDEPERPGILRATTGHELVAPAVLPFEIGNALTVMLKKGALEAGHIAEICDTVRRIPVELRDVDIRSALSIVAEKAIDAYDAYFLECCIDLRCPLMSLDKGLVAVAAGMGISVVEVKSR